MRICVLGGTRFVGRAIVEHLAQAGHELLLVHRGHSEPEGLPPAEHLHLDRALLAAEPERLAVFAPEALVDTYAMTAAHAEQALLAAFNVCEARSPTARLWAEEILRAAGSDARLVRVPDERLPPDLALTGAAQPLLASTGKARRVLGWRETEAGEAVGRSVRWHLANPPPDEADFEADDDALRHAVDAA